MSELLSTGIPFTMPGARKSDPLAGSTSISVINRVAKLRERIKARTEELNIQPQHDDSGHWYVYQGQKYGSVTKSLQILKDPALMNWKMNRALEYLREHRTPLMDVTQFDELIEAAKLAPVQEFEGAGDIGRQVHEWREKKFQAFIEGYFTTWYTEPEGLTLDYDQPAVISGCRAIIKFMDETRYTPLACELFVADPVLEIGGTADDIGLLDGKLTFLDLKTSNIGDKDSYFYQVALYVYMFEKLYGMRTQAWKILHVSKTDGTYKLIDIPDIRKRIREAKQIIKVDKFLEALKQEKKKVPIVI